MCASLGTLNASAKELKLRIKAKISFMSYGDHRISLGESKSPIYSLRLGKCQRLSCEVLMETLIDFKSLGLRPLSFTLCRCRLMVFNLGMANVGTSFIGTATVKVRRFLVALNTQL